MDNSAEGQCNAHDPILSGHADRADEVSHPWVPGQIFSERAELLGIFSSKESSDTLINKLYQYLDGDTGFTVGDIEIATIGVEKVRERLKNWTLGEIHDCRHVQLKVFDAHGKKVGEFSRYIIVTQNNDIFVEHDTAAMDISGTGFGNRFQAFVEDQYKRIGVKAVIRGCGQFVGRYEGAKNGFDFCDEQTREKYMAAFCAFLEEHGVQSVSFGSDKNISLTELRSVMRTPQDILKVVADKSVNVIEIERSNRQKEPPRSFFTIDKHEKQYQPQEVGKAFFLDEGSQAKRNMEPETDHEQYSLGRWAGIKYL